MKREHVIGLYIGASLLTAGLLFIVFFVLPHRSALNLVNDTTKLFNNSTIALGNSQSALAEQPGPNVIEPGVVGSATEYNHRLNSTLTSLSIEPFETPGPINNRWRDKTISGFNSVLSDSQFESSVSQTNGTINEVHGFITYYYKTMQALRNILEYNAVDDLSISDTEGLLASIRAAGVGIERSTISLTTQTYADDPGLDALLALLKTLEAKRSVYERALETGNIKGVEYNDFVNSVSATQRGIIANRQQFWEANQPVLTQELDQAYQIISQYRTRLNNI